MIIFPAIDLIGGKAVRLYRGDYDQMTVYDDDPVSVALRFREAGAAHVHLVDLEGARDGGMPNRETVIAVKKESGLFCEVGGGIRSMESVEWYLSRGVDRVILGTAAVTDPVFAKEAASAFPGRIAAGADLKDGMVAVKGWREKSVLTADEFIKRMKDLGITALIVTNISRDGAMQGTDLSLYRRLKRDWPELCFTASGGVSDLMDVQALKEAGVHAAIIGKAYYTGAIDLKEAVEAAQ